MNKFKYMYRFYNAYLADPMTKHFCRERGEETAGTEKGQGWGATPAIAKRRAKSAMISTGNTNVNWIIGTSDLFMNGKLIKSCQ